MKIDLEQRLINPPPGSALAVARDFGVDLSLLAGRLRLSPEERLRDLQRLMRDLERIRGVRRGSRVIDLEKTIRLLADSAAGFQDSLLPGFNP